MTPGSKSTRAIAVFQSFTLAVSVTLAGLLWVGCHSTPPPPSAPSPLAPQAAAPAPAPVEVRTDDIPADALPAIRAHLVKLREMRDLGQITDADYQSRKASLLRQ
jgi:hypothetical protein